MRKATCSPRSPWFPLAIRHRAAGTTRTSPILLPEYQMSANRIINGVHRSSQGCRHRIARCHPGCPFRNYQVFALNTPVDTTLTERIYFTRVRSPVFAAILNDESTLPPAALGPNDGNTLYTRAPWFGPPSGRFPPPRECCALRYQLLFTIHPANWPLEMSAGRSAVRLR